jgi:hypothetical protein
MLPAREFPLDEDGRARFRERFRERFEGDPTRSRIYKDVSNGIAPAGVEAYLPLFFDATATLFDYLPEGTRVRPARRRAGSGPRLLEGPQVAPRPAARRPRPAAARAARALRPGRGPVRGAEGVPAARGRGAAGGAAAAFHRRGHAARPLRGQGRRPGGARAARHRPLPRPADMDLGEGETSSSRSSTRRRQALRAGVAAASDQPLQRRAPEQAPLHQLGSGQWEKAKRKAAKQVRDTAAELLNLYAQRARAQGHAFS